MKKLFNALMIALALGMVLSLVSCGPTFGLEEVSFEEIADANITGTYNVNSETTTYDADGNGKTVSANPDTVDGAAVKIAVAASKLAINASKLVYSKTYGNVYTNKSFSKIMCI